ncbi:ABC transporter ATP-binding protein [Granulicella aggregans]|uniref:ABC transporter ATP-binding protein n=1 Tax=Granulicella aggregans TaxID=474949 RepID=UPI0021E0A645|nr:ABC transporter ATP-binding protein [Granulicella aggregans]
MTSAIQTRQLSKRYRRTTALNEVTLDIPPGAIYALVGANGAGKTTLIKLLMNILRPSSGAATVLDIPSTKVAGAAFDRIGYVSENQELPESMTVSAFLAFMRPFYPKWDNALEAQLVQQFDLPLDRKLKNLSRGMKMKAALASALAYRPSLIVLDEPFSGLDPLVRDELIESLLERASETTILLSSHDLAEIESFASHVGYLEQGRLLFSEEMASLSARFREVEITLPASSATVTPNFPETWLLTEHTGSVLRFIDSRFDADTSPSALASRFPDSTGIAIEAMPLRAIFLAIAKSGRPAPGRPTTGASR